MVLKQYFNIPTSRERESRTKGSYWDHTSQLGQGHQVIFVKRTIFLSHGKKSLGTTNRKKIQRRYGSNY